ncbi:uncharacterized protein LOC107427772 isoform X1 [Ziziphus jujuba]|uniref:Uncharacterized protein LOC107427772 isoform X1 n=1 Tax=Ziziphus jujuba TaxID=326968 RepID=A0A6P4B5C0_ZIZJJ|nr:uncharacterized protein LOC107427772 isoform X1 [Ziziphus jujuba]
MAFDQNSIPKDLRPLNVARTVAEEPRITPATTTGRSPDGFFPSSAREIGSPDSVPVFYPAAVSEAGFVGLGYGNAAPGVAAWCPLVPAAVGHQGVSSAVGYGYSPNLGTRVAGAAVDLISSGPPMVSGSNPNLGNRIGAGGADHASHDMAAKHVYGNRVGVVAADQTGNDSATCSGYSPNLGGRTGGSGTDQASEEGGDDSVSGKKVKFLCSFGGKIYPRPSDGMLRYVGGHTRIISVRRDVSFNELVQKMVDTYGQPVVIKYQLPDEDLDALVSVSCPDDLDNMMDEYEKLLERSSDGSAKLRVFLFSASELDPSGVVQFGDLHDSGQRYVDAVNGIMDVVGGNITRKESIASATSTQNSDFSGTEVVDSLGPGQGDVTGPLSNSNLSPKGNSDTSHDTASKLVFVDPSHAVYADASAVPFGIPVVKSGPPQTLTSRPEVELERSVPATLPQQQLGLQQPGMEIPPPTSYVQSYVDPRQEVVNHGDYIHLSPQMGFPSPHLLGTAGPVFTQQQFRDTGAGMTPHHFIPAVHMTLNPSSSCVGIRPNMVQPLVQPQQTQLDSFVDERTFGPRVVQLPVEQSYNSYQVQVPSAVVGGGYSWHQVPPQEHVIFSDGSVPHQQVIYPEKITRLEDCYMCQKALPHAHSDTVVQGQKGSPSSSVSDSISTYHSLRLDDNLRTQPVTRVMATGALGEGTLEQGIEARPKVLGHGDPQTGNIQPEATRLPQIPEGNHENERINLQQVDNIDHPRIPVPQGVIGRVADLQASNGAFVGTIPQSSQTDSVQQWSASAQCQVKQDTLVNKIVTRDMPPVGGVPVQTSECMVHESPKEYSSKLPGVIPKEDPVDTCMSYEQLRPIDARMETLRISPSETYVNKEHGKLPVDKFRMEESSDHRIQQVGGRDVLLDKTFDKFETSNFIPAEMLPSSSAESPYMHNSRLIESYEVAQPPMWGNPGSYAHSKLGVHQMNPNEVHYGNPAFAGIDSAHLTDRVRPSAEWMDDTLRLQSKVGQTNADALLSNVQDSSNSLFSNQDPWNLHHDTQFPPPRPNRVPSRKELFSPKDPVSENHLGNSGELNTMEDGVQQPFGNMNRDVNSEHARSAKGSAEEQIKQELQAVAEGVAASVFQPSTSANPDLRDKNESSNGSKQDGDVENSDAAVQHNEQHKDEDVKTKMPEKANVGFPVSDGIGRLQIIMNSDLEELRELGSGTFGTVYHGKWRGTDVAIKRINDRCFSGKASEQERMRDDFWNEAIKLADLHHPNVVAFYGVVLDGPGGSVATVTEYMVNGSLRNALQKNEKILDKRKRLLIAMDVAFGMEYLHGKNIVHFDLKSDNLLVNLRDPHRPICKVGDLGLSKVKCQTLISGGVRGTLPWMAPELLNGSSSLVSEKVDVFSFGIVLWELLTGEEPYADLHYGAIIGGIVSNTLRPAIPESCDLEWKSLMESCWSSEPSERPSFTEIANHLRAMAAKIPPKGQNQPQQPSSTQPPVQK